MCIFNKLKLKFIRKRETKKSQLHGLINKINFKRHLKLYYDVYDYSCMECKANDMVPSL